MKMNFPNLVFVVAFAAICFSQVNTMSDAKCLATDIPITINPPVKVPGIKSIPKYINIKTLPKPTTKLA